MKFLSNEHITASLYRTLSKIFFTIAYRGVVKTLASNPRKKSERSEKYPVGPGE
jgi:hypothetical protein